MTWRLEYLFYLAGSDSSTSCFIFSKIGTLNLFLTSSFSWPAQFVDDACYQIEKYERNVRQIGVVPYIPRSIVMVSYYMHNRIIHCGVYVMCIVQA